ncbi:unnamed protein product [Auanema sp. JU1783]|nr:unnamed protein product [Auanema sp. JU1783]CAI4230832.1 unnamed protein product [Auanema sp. JU1783]
MIIEVLLKFSVITGQTVEKLCKVCYGEEDHDGWLCPCRCSGTLKWVHKDCFDMWMKQAPVLQKAQCQTCRHMYEKLWTLKPIKSWSKPDVNVTWWDCLEIFLDSYATFKFFRGIWWTIEGRRAVWVQIAHFLFWRTFIASNQRLTTYKTLAITLMSAIFEMRVKDYETAPKTDSSLIILDKQVIDGDRN